MALIYHQDGGTKSSGGRYFNTPATGTNLINKGVQNVANLANTYGLSSSGATTGSGSSGGGAVNASVQPTYDSSSTLAALIAAKQAARQKAIDAANSALDDQARIAGERYNASREQIENDHQDLRNKASVQNFKSGKYQREALANRGALNSGMGLQERLQLSSNLNNMLNKINTQAQSAYDTLKNNYDSYVNQINMQKAMNMASGLDDYGNIVSSMISGAFNGYQPSEGYTALLQALTGGGNNGISNVVQSNNGVGNSLYDTLLRYL